MGKSSDDFEDTKVVKKAKIQKKSKKTMGDSSDDFEDTKVVKKAKKIKKPEKENEPPKDNANEWKPSYNKGNKKTTLDDLNRTVFGSKISTIDWLMDQKVLADKQNCPICQNPMRLVVTSSTNDGWRWRCTRKIKGIKHDKTLSIRNKSWFARSNLTLKEVILITYYWSHGLPQTYMQHELNVSSATTVDWSNFAREVCEEVVLKNSEQIGGPGIEVEIDESKFGKRKYNRGRKVEGQWVFGGREKNNRSKIFMVPVEKRDKDTLLPIIQRFIAKGSVIISDCWKSYDCLKDHGYTHKTVNHSEHFKDPVTDACTNHIECEWLHVKKNMAKYGTKHEHISSYLGAHLWNLRVKEANGDVFLEFLKAVRSVFDPDTWESITDNN